MDGGQCPYVAHLRQRRWIYPRLRARARHGKRQLHLRLFSRRQSGLDQLGGNTLTLSATNGYLGPTTVLGGTLAVANSEHLLGSTLIAPTSGSIVFNPVASHAYSLGGLGGTGNIALQDSAGTAIALSVGGNNADSTYSGADGSGSLTKIGWGTLTLNHASNTCGGGVTVNNGEMDLAATGSLSTGSTGNLCVGPKRFWESGDLGQRWSRLVVSWMWIIGTGRNPSVLTLSSGTAGSLTVAGSTVVGRAAVGTDPSNISAIFAQTGGSSTFAGVLIVGYNGSATSLFEIGGGGARPTTPPTASTSASGATANLRFTAPA